MVEARIIQFVQIATSLSTTTMSLLRTGSLASKKVTRTLILSKIWMSLQYSPKGICNASRREFHSSFIVNKSARDVHETRVSPGPRYVQGPTLPGLKLVVQVLKDGPPQMLTRRVFLGLGYTLARYIC
jgi:hypothetical protein